MRSRLQSPKQTQNTGPGKSMNILVIHIKTEAEGEMKRTTKKPLLPVEEKVKRYRINLLGYVKMKTIPKNSSSEAQQSMYKARKKTGYMQKHNSTSMH